MLVVILQLASLHFQTIIRRLLGRLLGSLFGLRLLDFFLPGPRSRDLLLLRAPLCGLSPLRAVERPPYETLVSVCIIPGLGAAGSGVVLRGGPLGLGAGDFGLGGRSLGNFAGIAGSSSGAARFDFAAWALD